MRFKFRGEFTKEEFERLNDSFFENGDVIIVKDDKTEQYYMYTLKEDVYVIFEPHVVDMLLKELKGKQA